MFKLSHATLYTISGLVWLAIGLMLLNTGLVLIMSGFQASHFNPEHYSSIFPWLATVVSGPDNAAVMLIGASLAIGFAKGRFVLQKAAQKSYDRIRMLDNPTNLTSLYSPANYILIAAMMGIGMLMKTVGLPLDIRGAIDTAVGCALMQGAIAYFQFAAFAKKRSA